MKSRLFLVLLSVVMFATTIGCGVQVPTAKASTTKPVASSPVAPAPTPKPTCQDTTATNFGGTLPCVYPPVTAPIPTPTPTPTSGGISEKMAAAIQTIVAANNAVAATEAPQPVVQSKRATFLRKSLATKVQGKVHAMEVGTSSVYSDPVGYQLILAEKYVSLFLKTPQSATAWLRQDYPNGGTFVTLEFFIPDGGGSTTFSIQGPTVIGSSPLGTILPLYSRNDYPAGEGRFILYSIFEGGDGSLRVGQASYHLGGAPLDGQQGYYVDSATADPDTLTFDVQGVFPKGVPINVMFTNSDSAGWGGETFYSLDGKHLYHLGVNLGAYVRGTSWGLFSQRDDNAAIHLYFDGAYLTLRGIFTPAVDFSNRK